jgi:hypothetical protein
VESTIRVPVLTILPIPFLRVSGAFPVHGAPRFSKISCRLLHRSNSVRSSLTHESPVCSNHPQQCLARWGSQATGRMQVWSHTPGQRRCLPRTATKGILALPVKSVISACGCQLWRSRRTCRLDCRGSCPSWKKPLRRPRKRNAYQHPHVIVSVVPYQPSTFCLIRNRVRTSVSLRTHVPLILFCSLVFVTCSRNNIPDTAVLTGNTTGAGVHVATNNHHQQREHTNISRQRQQIRHRIQNFADWFPSHFGPFGDGAPHFTVSWSRFLTRNLDFSDLMMRKHGDARKWMTVN